MLRLKKTVQQPKGYLFTNGDLKRLIVPLIIEQILAVTVGMVDTMMVSSAGQAATSGVSLVDMINNLLINLFAAVATGGAVVASQYLGQKNTKKASETAGQLLVVTGIISVIMMITAIFCRQGLLHMLYGDLESAVMKNALIYLVISAISYPFLAIYNSCAALFRSMGNSKISMQVSIVMNVINIAGDAIFIFGFHMGVAGAAIASLISRVIACMVLVGRLKNPKLEIHLDSTVFKWNRQLIQSILKIGIPGGIENSVFQLGRVLVVSMITLFGTAQIAANAVANNLDALGVLPGQAMNLAMITVIGQCVGAGDYPQAEYYAKKMMKLTYIINTLTCLSVIFTMPLTLRLYGLPKETLVLAAILVLLHDGIGILLWPAAFTLTSVFRAANDVKFPMGVSVVSMIFFRLVMGYILAVHMGYGAIGVWLAMILDWIVRVIFFVNRYRSGKWKKYLRNAI
ncbi:MAG: MATE family efflux transporter [Hespellia sp.]|nr:MATE family efflux transporter [Hespellia sp.]